MLTSVEKTLSVIIPARNEVALIGLVLKATLQAVARYSATAQPPHLDETDVEIIVVDNYSTDGTSAVVTRFAERYGVRLITCERVRAPCARNAGAQVATGEILVFVDADTLLPSDGVTHILQLTRDGHYQAGMLALRSLEGGALAWCWWAFWGQVRRLPVPRAKAMGAAMFCTRELFDTLGPFNEEVSIGEEWSILASAYRTRPERFIYAQNVVALTSSRRMNLQPFGYLRTFGRYVWAVLHASGRQHYGDHLRHSHR